MFRRPLTLALAGLLVASCADADDRTAATIGTLKPGSPVATADGSPTVATDVGSGTSDTAVSIVRPTSPPSAPVDGSGATTTVDAVDQPPAPIAGCMDAPVGPSVVSVSFDDDHLRYAALVAPPCLRVHAAQAVRVVNAAAFSSSVFLGATSTVIGIGQSYTTAALGTFHGVGDVFDVRVEVLGMSMLVQVLR